MSLLASASTVPSGYEATTVTATPGALMPGSYSYSKLVAYHVAGALNVGSQNVVYKLHAIRAGVDTVLATVTIAANVTASASATFAYTTALGDILYVSAQPSAVLTVTVTSSLAGVS